MHRVIFLASVVLILATGVGAIGGGAQKAEQDSPRFRGAKGDGISSDTGLLKSWPKGGLPLVWQSDPVGEGFSSVSVAGPRVYTMGDD
jgi:outer membrane protein assembly factor BamB